MTTTNKQPVAGALAGAMLGLLAGVFAPDRPPFNGWGYGLGCVVLGSTVCAVVGLWANRPVSKLLMIPVAIFGTITVIPVWPWKSGALLPLGAAYINRGFPWLLTLTLHVGLTVFFSAAVILTLQNMRRRSLRGTTDHTMSDAENG